VREIDGEGGYRREKNTGCEMKLESIIEKLDKFCILHNIFMISE
jgi:hypothetical protein